MKRGECFSPRFDVIQRRSRQRVLACADDIPVAFALPFGAVAETVDVVGAPGIVLFAPGNAVALGSAAVPCAGNVVDGNAAVGEPFLVGAPGRLGAAGNDGAEPKLAWLIGSAGGALGEGKAGRPGDDAPLFGSGDAPEFGKVSGSVFGELCAEGSALAPGSADAELDGCTTLTVPDESKLFAVERDLALAPNGPLAVESVPREFELLAGRTALPAAAIGAGAAGAAAALAPPIVSPPLEVAIAVDDSNATSAADPTSRRGRALRCVARCNIVVLLFSGAPKPTSRKSKSSTDGWFRDQGLRRVRSNARADATRDDLTQLQSVFEAVSPSGSTSRYAR